MQANIELITDSTCSLPKVIVDKYQIKQAPLKINIDNRRFVDPCNEDKSLAIFKSGKLSKKYEVSTEPPSTQEFEELIYDAVERGHKMIVIQTVNRTQGNTYNNANIAVSNARRKLNDNSIHIKVMDSRTVFAGQALMATETVRLVLSRHDSSEVKRYMDNLSQHIHTFILPKEPLLAFERAKKRNMKAVGWTQAFLADTLGIHPILCNLNDTEYMAAKPFGFKNSVKQLFHHASQRIDAGLMIPMVAINYAGSIEELKTLPGFAELEKKAQDKKIHLLLSVMSVAGGIYTSVGSISLAFACNKHEWEGQVIH